MEIKNIDIKWTNGIFDIIKNITTKVKELKEDVLNNKEDLIPWFIEYIEKSFSEEEIKKHTNWKNLSFFIKDQLNTIWTADIFKLAVDNVSSNNENKKEETTENLIAGYDTITKTILNWEWSLWSIIENFVFIMKTWTRKNVVNFLNERWISVNQTKTKIPEEGDINNKETYSIITKEQEIKDIEQNNTEIDIKKIKEGIFSSESKNEEEPYKAKNKKSSAVGKYQFLWETRKDKIKTTTNIKTKEEYLNNPEKQEKFMDHVIENIYLPKAKKIQSNYNDWNVPEIIMLLHFKWEKWALDRIKNKEDKTMANNISIEKYINNFKKQYYA